MKLKINKYKLSATLIILVAFAAAILRLVVYPPSLNDFGWHIKTGEYIVKNHVIPTTDMLSWTVPGQKWFAHEWLFDALLYIISGGNVTICIVFILALIAATYFIICRNMKVDVLFKIDILWFYILIISIVIMVCSLVIRPQYMSALLLAALFAVINKAVIENKMKYLLFALPIQLLWSNMHGGSSNLVYLILLIIGIVSFIDMRIGRCVSFVSAKDGLTFIAVGVLCMGVSCINPHGVDGFLYPYVNMADKRMLEVIAEWQPPDAKDLSMLLLYFAPLGCAVLKLIADKKEKLDLVKIVLFAFFSLLFFRSIRFWIYLYIVELMIIVPRDTELDEIKPVLLREKISIGVISAILIGLIVAIPIFASITEKAEKGYPQEMYEDIREVGGPRMYNDYNTGTDLVQHDIKVFQDSRYDLYTANTYGDKKGVSENTIIMDSQALETSCAKEDTIRTGVIKKYDFTSILMSPETELAKWLCENGWFAYKTYSYQVPAGLELLDSTIMESDLTLYLPKKTISANSIQ